VRLEVEQEEQDQAQKVSTHTGPVAWVDLGITSLATLSDGTVIANPRPLKRRLKQLKRFHRAVSRKVKGSKNRKKAARRLGRLCRKATHERQFTTRLANTKAVIAIEELNVAGMLKHHHLAQAIAEVGFSEFKRQLTYKAAWYGAQVVLSDRWHPSSKTCSGCGWVDEELRRSDRVFRCQNPDCGQILDRDLNAARTLA